MRPEQKLETDYTTWVRGLGGLIVKLSGTTGWPDRLVVLPRRVLFFVEFKVPGAKPEPLQEYVHKMLREMGQTVYVWRTLVEAKEITLRHMGIKS